MRASLLALTAIVAVLAATGSSATSYTYDDLGRVVMVTYDNKQVVYIYDDAGNRAQVITQGNGNHPPTANDDSASTPQGVAVAVNVLSNDSDSDPGDTLTVSSVANGAHGSVSITAPNVTYTPTSNFYGTDSFPYTISDGHNHTASANVTVTVVSSDQPPNAGNDNISLPRNHPYNFDPLANDSDPEHEQLTITQTSTPSHGTVAIVSGLTLTYTPVAGYGGADSFTYTISDGHNNTATATVSASVSTSNQSPAAANDSLYTSPTQHNDGDPVTPSGTLDPRSNDSDPDGDPLTITAKTNGTKGTVSIGGGGTSVTYTYTYNTPVLHTREDTDSFTYTISDGHGGTATATIAVTINVGTYN